MSAAKQEPAPAGPTGESPRTTIGALAHEIAVLRTILPVLRHLFRDGGEGSTQGEIVEAIEGRISEAEGAILEETPTTLADLAVQGRVLAGFHPGVALDGDALARIGRGIVGVTGAT